VDLKIKIVYNKNTIPKERLQPGSRILIVNRTLKISPIIAFEFCLVYFCAAK